MNKKRLVGVVLGLLLVLSIFTAAQEAVGTSAPESKPVSESSTVSEAQTCGFWCKINQFLFGSAENRAGKGWFDRKEALVGMGGATCDKTDTGISCQVPQGSSSSTIITFTENEVKQWTDTEHFTMESAAEWKYNQFEPGVARTWWDRGFTKPSDAFQWNLYGFSPTEAKKWNDNQFTNPTSAKYYKNAFKDNKYAENFQNPDYLISWVERGFDNPTEMIQWQEANIGPNTAKEWKDGGFTAKTANDWNSQNFEVSDAKSWSNDGYSAGYARDLVNNGHSTPAAAILAGYYSSDTAADVKPATAGPAESPTPTDEKPATAGTSAPAAASTFVYNPTITDGTLTVQGPEVLHKYTPVSEAKLGDKPVYQYSADNVPQSEWYVAEGDGFVRVIQVGSNWKYLKNDGTTSTTVSEAKKSTLIGEEVKITAGADGKITSTAKTAPAATDSKKAETPKSPTAPSKPATTYTEIFKDSLGDTPLSKKIKEKYFDKDGLKKEYTFDKEAGTITKKNDQKVDETVLTLKTESSGIVKVSDMILPTKEGETSTYTHTLFFSGKEIASQTEAQMKEGKAVINGNTVLMEDGGKFITDNSIDFSKPQLFYDDEEDKSNDVVKSTLQVADGKITYTDAGEETQTITDTKNNEITELGGDWDSDDKDFTPSDGTIYEIDKKTGEKGKAKYLADYDYKDGKLETVELFDPITGDYLGDDTNPADGFTPPSVKPAQITKTVLSSIYAAATSVKDYPAISKVLGITDWWKGVFEDTFMENFVTNADQTFAPMLGMNWFPSAICESHWDITPDGTAMIKTPTGTYQAVAHIEGERSAQKSPILCNRNPDQEAEQEWICDEEQVCLEDGFCYTDKDQNNKPDDEEKQLTGYFYKITWGVSAPSDETFTPFIDENGVAVTFNVVIKNSNTAEPLYSKEGDIDGPIELKNGDSDQDIILHYSPNLYTEVCIEWEHAPASIGEGFTGSFSGAEAIGDVCFDLVTSSVGEVNWEAGGKPSSTKASDPKVSTNTGW